MEKDRQRVQGKKRFYQFLLVSGAVLSLCVVTSMSSQSAEAENAAKTEQKSVAKTQTLGAISSIEKQDKNYLIQYESGEKAQLSVMKNNLFRFQMDPNGNFQEYPKPNKPEHIATITAKSMEDYGLEAFGESVLNDEGSIYSIETPDLTISFHKKTSLMSVFNKVTNKVVLEESAPLNYQNNKATQTLKQTSAENFFGGGTQNGRFTHKGTQIKIENTNNWVDGGVASPNPFYWSTNGYGVVRNTWKKGIYDFGLTDGNEVKTTHDDANFDAFYFFDESASGILKHYFELTGYPVLLPEYGFYEAHLNAYNRDYWVEASSAAGGAIKFEDGKWYKEYQPAHLGGQSGILESLNGEKNNYQFSARAVIDRYIKNDMPLGWFLPNDGYGAGYGQTDSLDGDIQNLKEFTAYANSKGVEVGLWTQSNLHPSDVNNPKKGERDIEKEVRVAGVKALKTDVAWVGYGYSFGLNGIEDAANTFVNQTNGNVRPLIVTLDGWAGTQRHGGIWSGDQTGGEWEYIRFHIPTYIGTSLSGQPNVSSDMDGIFGGGNKHVNIRDYQWKAFTPMQLNMDGWGRNEKNPFAFDKEATAINRAYLKFKSMMMPYNYSIARESVTGLPMVRAMALEYPADSYAYTKDTEYQYMWGPNLLIAPVYTGQTDAKGNSLRDNIYLPDHNQVWIDLFTGEKIQGGRVLRQVKTPLWKLPVYVKDGAIIPMTNPNNNPGEIKRDQRKFLIYPNQESSFEVYEDDGISTGYQTGEFATTNISSNGPKTNEKGDLLITVDPTEGGYNGFVAERSTQFDIMASAEPESVTAVVGGQEVTLEKAATKEEFAEKANSYYFDRDFQVNGYLEGLTDEKISQSFLSVKLDKQNVTAKNVQVKVAGFINKGTIAGAKTPVDEKLAVPKNVKLDESKTTESQLAIQWDNVDGAVSYDIERDGSIFSGYTDTNAIFGGFKFLSEHQFRVRSVGEAGVSEWSEPVIGKTNEDPFKNRIGTVKAKSNIVSQNGEGLEKLTDGDLSSQWHTNWFTGIASPSIGHFLTLQFDLGKVYEMDKFQYLPRENAGNGNFRKIQYRTSTDGINWTDYSKPISWAGTADLKTVETQGTSYRFLELKVLESVGNFGSGREMMFFKKDGAKGYLPGDITNDGKVDENDALSYRNYTGLEAVDSDFNGCVEQGDLNKNKVIDAYDISYVLRQLDGGIASPDTGKISGALTLAITGQRDADKYLAGDILTLTLKGKEFVNVNALSVKLDFDSTMYELVSQPTAADNAAWMENYSTYRKHSDSTESLYLVLSNQGQATLLKGDVDLVTFKVKVKEKLPQKAAGSRLVFKATQGLLVGQGLQQAEVGNFEAAIEQDTTVAIDKSGVDAINERLESLIEEDYTTESWQALMDLLQKGQEVIDNPEATQAQVDQIVKEINDKLDALEKKTEALDKTALNAAIKRAVEAQPQAGRQFTAETKAVLAAALKQAKQVAADSTATSEMVRQAADGLNQAVDNLKEEAVPADKTLLSDVIGQAEKLEPPVGYRFTDETKAALEAAVNTAKAVAADPAAAQQDVDKAAEDLQAAIDNLTAQLIPADKNELLEVLEQARQVTPSDEQHMFTPESLVILQKALNQAQEVLDNPAVAQEAVNEAVAQLQKALKGLEETPVKTDKTPLTKVIADAKKKLGQPSKGMMYTRDTQEALEKALADAEEVAANPNSPQSEIARATKAVSDAAADLKEQPIPVDKAKLEELIQQAETLKPSAGKQFTEATQKVLSDALADARKIAKKKDAAQKEVDDVLQALEEAVANLKEEPAKESSGGQGGNFGSTGSGVSGNSRYSSGGLVRGGLPKTNETVNPFVAVCGGIMAAGAVLVRFFFRSKEK